MCTYIPYIKFFLFDNWKKKSFFLFVLTILLLLLLIFFFHSPSCRYWTKFLLVSSCCFFWVRSGDPALPPLRPRLSICSCILIHTVLTRFLLFPLFFFSVDLEYRRIQRKYGKRRAPPATQSFPSSSNIEISSNRSEIQRRIAENTPTATIRKPVSAPIAAVRKSASMVALPVFGRRKSSAASTRPEEQHYDGKITNQYRKSSVGSLHNQQTFEHPINRSNSTSSINANSGASRSSAPVSRRSSYIDPGSTRSTPIASRRLSTPVTGSLSAHHSKSTTQLPTHYEYSLSTEIDREQSIYRSSIDDTDYHHYQRTRASGNTYGRGSSSPEFTFRHPQNFDLAQQQQHRRQQDQHKRQSFLSRKLSLLVGHWTCWVRLLFLIPFFLFNFFYFSSINDDL